jgi:hypothetical protein
VTSRVPRPSLLSRSLPVSLPVSLTTVASLSAVTLLGACNDSVVISNPDPTVEVVIPVYDPSRPTHYFDYPFPSDELLTADGTPDLTGYPVFGTDAALPIVDGWRTRLESVAQGFGNNTAAYFRFSGPISVPPTTAGSPYDPVLLVDMDTGELVPLVTRFITDPGSDPSLAENLLTFAPQLGHPPRSGAKLAAVVMASAGVSFIEGAVPDGVVEALALAGVTGTPAVATVYTVQDATGQLQQLIADADTRFDAETDPWAGVELKRVVGMAYTQGQTPSGADATVLEVTFEDGTTERSYQSPLTDDTGTHTVDMDAWPMVVYQAQVPVWNYSGLDDRPYMSPGLAHLYDTGRVSGWIDFENGQLTAVPDADSTRVTISIPKGDDGEPIENARVLMYDHGTGGTAYHAVQRRNKYDDCDALARVLADEGWAIVGRDQPLYGTRYPLIDEGHGASLGFYNIVNLPAFRDNQRQGAIEALQVKRFLTDALNDKLTGTGGSIDATAPMRRLGHSLGSVTLNLGSAATPDHWEAAFLSGTGGVFTHYFLDTGLIDQFDPSFAATLFALFDAEAPAEITAPAALGAALGLAEDDWDQIDRLHPVIQLFQWTMDPSDPMAVARDQAVPSLVFLGEGDYQVPNFTTEALHVALPDSEMVRCAASYTYDPHWCLHREADGPAVLRQWLQWTPGEDSVPTEEDTGTDSGR